jgi:hypothetical protein
MSDQPPRDDPDDSPEPDDEQAGAAAGDEADRLALDDLDAHDADTAVLAADGGDPSYLDEPADDDRASEGSASAVPEGPGEGDDDGPPPPPPPPPPPAAGGDEPPEPPPGGTVPVAAAPPGQSSARRSVGIGVGALALVVASVAGYYVGRSDADDDRVPAAFEDDGGGPGRRGGFPHGDDGDGGEHAFPDLPRHGGDDRMPGGRDRRDVPDGPEAPDVPGDRMPGGFPQMDDDGLPLFGTVGEVDDDGFVVDTLGRGSVTVTVADDTGYVEVGDDGVNTEATLDDVHDGDAVIVITGDDEPASDDDVQATDVLFGEVPLFR